MKSPEYRQRLDEQTRPGTLWRPGATPGSVVCVACPQRCRLDEGHRGACGLRFCREGVLRVPWGYTSSVALDPLEKKPFFHVCPGARVLSFGTLGCTLRCPFCQNWAISQAVRDDRALALPRPTAIADLLALAESAGSAWIATLAPTDVLVIGRKSLPPPQEQRRLLAKAAEGLRIVCFEQVATNVFGLRNDDPNTRHAFVSAAGHPLLQGLDDAATRTLMTGMVQRHFDILV